MADLRSMELEGRAQYDKGRREAATQYALLLRQVRQFTEGFDDCPFCGASGWSHQYDCLITEAERVLQELGR